MLLWRYHTAVHCTEEQQQAFPPSRFIQTLLSIVSVCSIAWYCLTRHSYRNLAILSFGYNAGHLPIQGRNVVLESKYGSPRIVNDGVTVAKEVELEDPVENIGAKLVRQVGALCCNSV